MRFEVASRRPSNGQNPDLLRHVARRACAAMAVIDDEGNVLFDTFDHVAERFGVLARNGTFIPTLDAAVRELRERFNATSVLTGVAFGDDLFVRLHSIRDNRSLGVTFGAFLISIETIRNRNDLAEATRRYAFTQREAEVLAHLMRGEKAGDIARILHIAEGTVQNYYKRLLAKTHARNRASMVAAVLGWKDAGPFRSLGK
jgi:DNA-binding CsgD family transcriptional regulator